MAKGSPDNQHELMVTALSRCLQQAYPNANFSFGTVMSELGLKPDIFVSHPDGRRWAYEMINKNADTTKIEAKHRQYLQGVVQVYWLLWETLAPGKPIDPNKVTKQLIWATEEQLERRRRYRLNKLQRTLVHLGQGCLYSFNLEKPLLDQVEYWLFKLLLIGIDIYRVSSTDLDSDRVEGQWEFIPLPYLTFSEVGQPQLKPGAGELAPSVATASEPLIEITTDRPILLKDRLQDITGLSPKFE